MSTDPSAELIQDFAELLDRAGNVVVFTGAGISTESGIPDFRSPGGVWDKNQPIYFQDFISSEDARRETWRRKIETDKVMTKARPNRGHMAISKLVAMGKVSNVVTQNIDGLHQASGVPETQVIELHGNSTYSTCLECGTRYENEPIKKAFARDGTLPVCDDCGGQVKTATVSFGQAMPEEPMFRARAAALECDLFISIGSSLVVFPAAGFPVMAKENGAALVILNRDPTEMDDLADIVLNTEIGETLGGVVAFD